MHIPKSLIALLIAGVLFIAAYELFDELLDDDRYDYDSRTSATD